MNIKKGVVERISAYRNPVYLMYALLAIPVFIIAALIAESGAGPLEVAIFNFFNGFGDTTKELWILISLFGTIGMVIVVSIIALFRKHYANALKILLAGILSYATAYWLKTFDIRPRPVALLDSAVVREDSIGTFGFPSGHAAVATVLALTAYQYLPKRWHRPVTILAILVMISRMYLGVHFPLDLVGGFAIGLVFGGVINFLLGSRKFSPVPPATVKQKMLELGMKVSSVKIASVDARGSTPYIAKMKNGDGIFVKIVGRENNVADWLFKSWRKIVYRRLEDESPFLNAKRQLEHEAYVSNLALLGGVRTPQVVGIFETEHDRWAHAQVAIPGKSLDAVPLKDITDNVLKQIWQQVEIMHSVNVVHRDLRCANVFLDNDDKVWIIDFGFSEGSMPEESKNRDRAELLASSATLVGAKRAVAAAMKVLSKKQLMDASSYLSYAVVSSATTKELKKQKGLLNELHQEIIAQTDLQKVKPVKIQRVSLKGILMVGAIVLGFIFMLPRINAFEDSFSTLRSANAWLVLVGILFSINTYAMAAFAYKALSYYPIRYLRMFLIQIASSFASKLAPAGAGGLAVNARFLTKNGHSLLQAGSIAGINNIMGFVGHMSILLAVVIFSDTSISDALAFEINVPNFVWAIAAFGFFAAGMIVYLVPKIRTKIIDTIKEMRTTFADYRKHPSRLAGSYIASVLITLSYTGALYASAHALGVDLSPLQVLIVFTVGIATASVTPTPGGIGGAEAGLVAALTATGLDASTSLSVTLLYRLLTYWLPILPGFIAFQYAAKKEYI